jgi:hypothetical protein
MQVFRVIICMRYSRFLKHLHRHGDLLPAPRRREAKKDDWTRIDHRVRVNSDDPQLSSTAQTVLPPDHDLSPNT